MAVNRRGFLKSSAALGCVPLTPLAGSAAEAGSRNLDLRNAKIVVQPGNLAPAEHTAAEMLADELKKRTGIRLRVSSQWPSSGAVIALTSRQKVPGWTLAVPAPPAKAEGYRLSLGMPTRGPVIWISGADARGVLYGAGRLLREVEWSLGKLSLRPGLDLSTAPEYAIRGHQLGYRAQANSYDAWSPAQFEQYIRELTFFGVNSIEGIPFHDDRKTPVMKFTRREINRAMGDACHRYGLDYWAWIPAEFDLADTAKRTQLLGQCEELFSDCKEFAGVFFPGGDPGQNPPELVLPFLEDVARRLTPLHPRARIWLSLQWFTPAQVDSVYAYFEREKPAWFAGLVAGPSSPPVPETRRRLAKQYKLRLYPDLTHNKLCQYEVPSWDQAFALTLGREAVNPRPAEFAAIHNRVAPWSDGFLSYSDGIHDDVNKTIWSALSWDSGTAAREVLVSYARVWFEPAIAEEAADAILALEKNWRGPAAENGAIEATLLRWLDLERKAPRLEGNWRWQMCLLRAYYDAYVRRRLLRESELETQANIVLARVQRGGADAAMEAAMRVLNAAVEQPTSPELRNRVAALCESLFHSIGLQTSVEKYHAIGAERGAVLDFLDYPLNNRWWLEDEFRKIRALPSEAEKLSRLHEIAAWENPGPGSYYDNPGNLAKSPHVVRADADKAAPELENEPGTTFWWWDQGKSRARLSWQVSQWPVAMVYEALDPEAAYVVRSTGFGQALLRINGERMSPTPDGRERGQFKEFPVPARLIASRRLVLTWDPVTDEEQLNWRNKSRLNEVWLLKRPRDSK